MRPSAAVRFGVNPRSPIRAIIAPSTITSSTRALTTATNWMPSIQSGDVGRVPRGHPVQDEREDDHQQGVEDADELAIERAAEPGHGVDDGGAGQHHREQRREEHRQHRRHVLHDPLLRLDEPRGHDHGTRRSRRQHPLGDPIDVDPRGLEDRSGQTHEHAAPERDQHVVDEPFAREADEVHAPLVRSDRAAHVRVGDDEPQHDGQMERDEGLGGRVRVRTGRG